MKLRVPYKTWLLVFQALYDFADCLFGSVLLRCLVAERGLTRIHTPLLVTESDSVF